MPDVHDLADLTGVRDAQIPRLDVDEGRADPLADVARVDRSDPVADARREFRSDRRGSPRRASLARHDERALPVASPQERLGVRPVLELAEARHVDLRGGHGGRRRSSTLWIAQLSSTRRTRGTCRPARRRAPRATARRARCRRRRPQCRPAWTNSPRRRDTGRCSRRRCGTASDVVWSMRREVATPSTSCRSPNAWPCHRAKPRPPKVTSSK